MAAHTMMLVDIPDDDGVHVKSAGAKGAKYVYRHIRYFRNDHGKPRNQSKLIGKFDADSGRMFPNDNYFDMYHVDPALPDVDVLDYGYSYLVHKVCHDIGLFKCLVGAFGEQRAMDILVIASYIIREGSAMDGIDDWLLRNYFPDYNRSLNSQSSSKILLIASLMGPAVARTMGPGEGVKRPVPLCHRLVGRVNQIFDIVNAWQYEMPGHPLSARSNATLCTEPCVPM